MDTVQMQSLEPRPTRSELFPTFKEHATTAEQKNSKKAMQRLGHICKEVRDGNLFWDLIEKEKLSDSRDLADVPAAARRRSSLAQQGTVDRAREEEERRKKMLERQDSRQMGKRDRGTSLVSSMRQFRTRRLPFRSFQSFLAGHGPEAAAENYLGYNSRRNSAADLTIPEDQDMEEKKHGKEVKKAKSVGHVAPQPAAATKEEASPVAGKGGREEAIYRSRSETKIKSEDSGYSSQRNSKKPNKLMKKVSRASSRYSQPSSVDQQQTLVMPMIDFAANNAGCMDTGASCAMDTGASVEGTNFDRAIIMNNPHPAAQSWSYHVPCPPRVTVPPLNIDLHSDSPALPFDQYSDHDFASTGFDNSEFLKIVTYDNIFATNPNIHWKYESRRNAQQVLPFLFLGPITAARDADFLRSQGITMLLAVRDIKSVHAKILGSKVAHELGIPCSTVDTSTGQELIAAFPRGIAAINSHLSDIYKQRQTDSVFDMAGSPGKVLVFCESGNERSAAMVVAYLMAMYSMDLIKAIQIVHNQRFSVAFDDTMKHLLKSYEHILQARRDVLQSEKHGGGANAGRGEGQTATSTSQGMLRKSSKRTLDDTYMEDVEMDVEVTPNEEAKREGAPPFIDDELHGSETLD
ncbi:MAG: hypothetical protein Q9213_001156 [Squamulea squamosa]